LNFEALKREVDKGLRDSEGKRMLSVRKEKLKTLRFLRLGGKMWGKERIPPFMRWDVTLNTNEKSQGICMYSCAACPGIHLK